MGRAGIGQPSGARSTVWFGESGTSKESLGRWWTLEEWAEGPGDSVVAASKRQLERAQEPHGIASQRTASEEEPGPRIAGPT